jgi:hypothetical protein
MAPGTLVSVALLAFLVLPALAAAEDGYIAGNVKNGLLGGPLSGATVALANTSFSTTTDAQGGYNLSAAPGNYTLRISATNYAEKTRENIRVTAGETTTFDTYLEKLKGSLSGRITDYDDGTPVQKVLVSPEGYLGAMTDADGRYSFEGIEVGNYKLNITPHLLYSSTNATVTIKAGQNVVKDFRLKAVTTVVFTVKDSGGKAILGATITMGNYSTNTDVDGIATLEVVPGPYVIKVQADGYKTAIRDQTIQKGVVTPFAVTLPSTGSGGGGGGLPVALVGGGVAAAVVVVLVLVILMRRKKAPAAGPAGAPGAPGAAPGPGAPPGQNTQAEKMKEWADFERMYGRPHPEAPGWVSAGAAAASAPKPKCPRDKSAVTYEPFSGQYFCSKCDERYTAEQVFRREDEVLQEERPAEGPARPAGAEETEKRAAGEKLELSTAQPTWALEHGDSVHTPGEAPPPAAAPEAAPPAAGAPPEVAPIEAAPVSDDEPAADAALPPGVNPEAGPIFNMPKPMDYTDLPPPAPPKEPPKTGE